MRETVVSKNEQWKESCSVEEFFTFVKKLEENHSRIYIGFLSESRPVTFQATELNYRSDSNQGLVMDQQMLVLHSFLSYPLNMS